MGGSHFRHASSYSSRGAVYASGEELFFSPSSPTRRNNLATMDYGSDMWRPWREEDGHAGQPEMVARYARMLWIVEPVTPAAYSPA